MCGGGDDGGGGFKLVVMVVLVLGWGGWEGGNNGPAVDLQGLATQCIPATIGKSGGSLPIRAYWLIPDHIHTYWF